MTFLPPHIVPIFISVRKKRNLQQSRNENRTDVRSLSSTEKNNLARKDEPVAMVASQVLKKMASEMKVAMLYTLFRYNIGY